jgi:hypothetical protein
MRYRNPHPEAEMNFDLGGKIYKVAAGAEVDIDDFWHPWVVSRGLRLEVVKPEIKKPASEGKPSKG